jgi:serine/threonine protein kinase
MKKRIGEESLYGEAWQATSVDGKQKFAIKMVPLSRQDLDGFSRKNLLSGKSVWREITAYILGSILITAGVCQNLPLFYKYFSCARCQFTNTNIKDIRRAKDMSSKCVLILNELADGNLENWLMERPRSKLDIQNAIFQIAAGLYAIQKYFDMTHNDLHTGNVLVHKIKKGGYWMYKINGKCFAIPNLGQIFVLWDFGMAHIPGKIRGFDDFRINDSKPSGREADIGRITRHIGEILKGQSLEIISKIKKKDDLEHIFSSFFESYRISSHEADTRTFIDIFDLDKKKKELLTWAPSNFHKFFK